MGRKKSRIFDYKDVETLSKYISPTGKILPRKYTKLSAKEQRRLVKAIKRARIMALLPFVREYVV